MNTASPPVHEYRVETEDGRLFIWSACDIDQIKRDFIERRYKIKKIQLLTELGAEQEKKVLALEFRFWSERELEEAAG